MHKILMLALLLLTAVWSQGQPANPYSEKSKAADVTTLQGCLHSADYEYTLTDTDGTVHTLAGSLGKLAHQVGHEVEVTGKPGTRSQDTTPAGGASSVKVITVFEVKTVKQVADTCKSY
jgi:hypothetical protein